MTGLQKIIKLESDLTHMFDSDQRVAMAVLEHIRTNKKSMLEEEEQLIVETLKNSYIVGYLDNQCKVDESMNFPEQYYNENFNIK